MRLLGLSFLCDFYVRELMTNFGFHSDAEKLSENDEQIEDQAASESQTRQRWVVTQL